MNYYFRTVNALRLFVWAYKNPQTLNANNFLILSDIIRLMFKVAKEKRPYLTQIATVSQGEKDPIVSVWAGPGLNASPFDRVKELAEENDFLRSEMTKLKSTK